MLIEQYLPIGILLVLAIVICLVIIFLSRLLGPFRPTRKKSAPYESGMTPIGSAVRRLPVKFYLVAVLFILFDIEIIFLLPYAVMVRELALYGLIVVLDFIIILAIGLFYVWKKGALEWD